MNPKLAPTRVHGSLLVPSYMRCSKSDWTLDMNHRIVSIPDVWFHAPEGETENLFYRLKGDRLMNDAGLDRFAKMFNQWEKDKSMEDDEYKPAMMISPFFIDDLLNPNKKDKESYGRFGFAVGGRSKGLYAGADIFNSVSTIYFLYNIGNWHWANFAMDPSTLKQRFYDSIHRPLDKDGIKTSKCIHEFLINFYECTMGSEHPRKKRWTRSVAVDNFACLRNAHQIGNDCGLHAVIVPVLLQAGIPLQVLGKNPAATSEELRIRMTLTFARNENFFVTESNQGVTLFSSQVGRLEEDLEVEDVPDKIRMVKRLYESIETPKCKKKSKRN